MATPQSMDEKTLEISVDDLISKTRELKSSLEQFLMKIEREQAALTWPSVLDSFALLSGQISSVFNLLQSEKVAPLQNYPIIPLRLGQEEDQYLQSITEGRLTSLNHSVVPDYLRTKAIPEVEQLEKQMTQDGNSISDTAVKNFNKLCDRMLDKLRNRQMPLTDQQFKSTQPTYNSNETLQLIAVANYGKDITTAQPQSSVKMQHNRM